MNIFFAIFLILNSYLRAELIERKDFDFKTFSQIAIQERGRTKPFETFALESLQYITGKSKWKGLGPTECLLGWLMAYDKEWGKEAFIRVDYKPLKEIVGLSLEKNYFSPEELLKVEELQKIVRIASAKEEKKEALSEVEKKAVEVQNRVGLVFSVVNGRTLSLIPHPRGYQLFDWLSLSALSSQERQSWINDSQSEKLILLMDKLSQAFTKRDPFLWNPTVLELYGFFRNELGKEKGVYPSVRDLSVESHYLNLRPFRWAWVIYLISFFALTGFLITKIKHFKTFGMALLIFGFLLQAYGYLLRCYIADRPPVSNMYESVIWVTWGALLFSLILGLIYKNIIIPMACEVFAIVGLVLADQLPSVLDPGIHPLEPVLRSNFWLTIHVLTITLSYAAFALSLCLGNVVLGHFLFKPKNIELIQNFSLYMYRAIQIGVILLAAGTILGGVWADYSWGRFWGWDPKEVWALIALLIYVAILHGRFSGWLKGFGFVSGSVLSFLSVLMAWYGVNFVLGVGLHSYGFGTGGVSYVLMYVFLQCVFIVAAYIKWTKNRISHESPPIFPKNIVR